MPTQAPRFTVFTYFATAMIAFACWQQGWFFAAVIAVTFGCGVAMARPVVQNRRLLLRGTPILLMFSVMLGSASGMAVVSDQVTDWMAPAEVTPTDCIYVEANGQADGCGLCVAGTFTDAG
ncbi:MAG: hypothetical protein AAAFM81_07430 [Pseudomonadota bacterium]